MVGWKVSSNQNSTIWPIYSDQYWLIFMINGGKDPPQPPHLSKSKRIMLFEETILLFIHTFMRGRCLWWSFIWCIILLNWWNEGPGFAIESSVLIGRKGLLADHGGSGLFCAGWKVCWEVLGGFFVWMDSWFGWCFGLVLGVGGFSLLYGGATLGGS